MIKPISRKPAMVACALALAASLASPAVPWAYASALAYEGNAGDVAYADEDGDGYDDNTDEWIGYGTASALAAQSESSGGSGASASSGSAFAPSGASGSSSSPSSSSASSSSDKKDDSKADDKDDKDSPSKDSDKDKEKTSSAFTFAGTGTTVDNATSEDGVEFFTIKTDDDNKVYYLVVDRNAGSENVYLLNTVTGSDLQALAESGTINLGTPALTQPKEEKQETATEQQEQQQGGIPEWLAYLLVVAVVGGGAFAYYRLKVKPEREESKVDEREVRSFEDDGIYPSEEFGQYDGSWQ